MKIAKGHYVPKELIASEAVHEAVVKCFVAAGFVERDGYGQMPCPGCFSALGVNDLSQGICWTNSGTPLTLQQLFTAENGLQWPENAYQIVGNDHGVWFCCDDHIPVVISGAFESNSRHSVIAYRQPKENEVQSEVLSNQLGFIGKYRWGVEYPTNGKRPDLPGDVLCNAICQDGSILGYNDHTINDWHWPVLKAFKITDQRYKPADTSYLNVQPQDQSLTHSEEGLTHSWHERGELPPVGTQCEIFDTENKVWKIGEIVKVMDNGMIAFVGHYFSGFSADPRMHRPIRTEREKFSDDAEAAFKATGFDKLTDWGFLYDAGFRGPKVDR